MPANGAHPEARGDSGDKQVFTTGEAARICNVSQQTIIRCFDRGRLSGFRVPGSRFRRIPRNELIRFMEANDIPLHRLNEGRVRALIVGPERGPAAALAEALRGDARFDVRFASCAIEAGLEAGAFVPHVAVLGHGVPGVDAQSLDRSFRAHPVTSATRVFRLEALDAPVPGALPGDRLNALLEGPGAPAGA